MSIKKFGWICVMVAVLVGIETSVLKSCQASEVDLSAVFHPKVGNAANWMTGAATLALLADWTTTRNAAKDWDACACEEVNGQLGNRPTVGKVNKYFALLMAAHIGINWWARDSPTEAKIGVLWGENITIFVRHGLAAYDNHTTVGLSYGL